MKIEEYYARLNATVKPSEDLIRRTREAMLAQQSRQKEKTLRLPQLHIIKPDFSKKEWHIAGRVSSYVGVAAAAVLVFVLVTGQTGLLRNRAEMPNAITAEADAVTAEEAAAAVETGEVTMFVPTAAGALEEKTCTVPLTMDDIFGAWCDLCGIEDFGINEFSVDMEGGALAVYVDLGDGFQDAVQNNRLLLDALSMTFAEYLNADGLTMTCCGEEL